MVAMKPIHDWSGEPGEVVSWNPSQASVAKVAGAPVSDVPVSYQQEQHLLAFRRHVSQGTDMARLNIPAWDVPGRCDIRAMSHVINAYLRRHDTFHSWFEYVEDGSIRRRTVSNPRDIKFVPTKHGEMSADQWREHILATPDPWQWDCFRFGIIQRDNHFTMYISVDHVHTDAMFMGLAFVEIHMMYQALVQGAAPLQLPDAGSYDRYCLEQRKYTAALDLNSPEVRDWITFLKANNGTLPRFPFPLGDPSLPHTGDVITVELLDKEQADRFEKACIAAGARFSGGVFACGALAQYALTGEDTYRVITPTTTRRSENEFMTTGWFTGLVPITVELPTPSFSAAARVAQQSFDGGMDLAHVPFERVLELADPDSGIRSPDPGVPMLSYLDAGLLSPAVIAEWQRLNGTLYSDSRSAFQVGMWVNRVQDCTTVTAAFPSNPVARESVLRYLEAMKAAYLRVVEGHDEVVHADEVGGAAALGLKTA
ncbi:MULTISPECIES: condensation domain-containing protein [Mycobacterium]|nr:MULTISPECIES: condensation domain-containing protein [Mycobacterium]MCG7611132.1 condensation domain-containing protein [Mycobacterium sp. CnD-18-1]